MAGATTLRRALLHFRITGSATDAQISTALKQNFSTAAAKDADYTTLLKTDEPAESQLGKTKISESEEKWFTLPPFDSSIDPSSLGKMVSRSRRVSKDISTAEKSATARKWVLRCCPQLPTSLVQKLFRKRHVRKECSISIVDGSNSLAQGVRVKRVAATDTLNEGDKILLPISVQERVAKDKLGERDYTQEELKYIRSLVLYKDPAIIAINKPAGLAVQGGVGIKSNVDQLAAICFKYDLPERPRLVHRLDKDCSGILVMGRTKSSAIVLQSVFHEKTMGASSNDVDGTNRALQKRYLALVLGVPQSLKGSISVPLAKVIVDDGKSERITISRNAESSQSAVTEYRVVQISCGLTWLELFPVTGRKHQLRVHCAEVLGTPVLGDYKYGWQAHRRWKPLQAADTSLDHEFHNIKMPNLGLSLGSGSVLEKEPQLHLHCKQMILPNVSVALEHASSDSNFDFSTVGSLSLVAPLPVHMQRSWIILNSLVTQDSSNIQT